MIVKRYEILEELGQGRMGTVYRARDRLTGTEVVLKPIDSLKPAGALFAEEGGAALGGPAPSSESRLGLLRELGRLATLRHPNLLSVLDYGFDFEMRPFYTRQLAPGARFLLEAGGELAFQRKVELLIEVSQALVYLHRRGVVHGDLRRPTVLVEGGRIRVSDFGLSRLPGLNEAETSESVRRLAPELLASSEQRPPPTAASDLYALGMLAFELLCGHPPYEKADPEATKERVRHGPPELSTAEFDARLIPILNRLLATDPEQRYSDAGTVIADLTRILGKELPEETPAIRESFLRTARLVGRDAETDRLRSLLEAALRGRGSSVLVTGENGVGKSRLVEELATLSLAEGAEVLAGRAVGEGFDPFQLWREVLRHLCLLVHVDEATAAEVKRHVPDLEKLLGREVRDAAPGDTQAVRQSFHKAVERLFRRLKRPAVVLLEDLQWAGSESLALLARLEPVVARLSVLVVGTYRDDERPDLSALLEKTPVLKLARLGKEGTAELIGAMLGATARPELVDFLFRETRGNALFLVEVVRALAEEAGRLDRIDPAGLPAGIPTGGIRRIFQQRLERIPRKARRLLRLAAVAGRSIDLELLSALRPGFVADLWLRICSEAAVIEVEAEGWRFAHARLRETLLNDMAASELRAAHRRIAEAVESVYGVTAERIPALAHHWSKAADLTDPEATGKAVDYLEQAGRAAIESCAVEEARRLLARGLELCGTLSPSARRLRQEIGFQVDLGGVFMISRGYTAPEVGYAFARARHLCERSGDGAPLLPALLGLWRFVASRPDLDMAARLAAEVVRQAGITGKSSHRLVADYIRGSTLFFRGQPEGSIEHLQSSMDLFGAHQAESRPEIREAVFYLGENPGVSAMGLASLAYWSLGFADHALGLSRRTQMLADLLDHPFSQAFARTTQAWLDQLRDDPAKAEGSAREAVELCERQGFPFYLGLNSALYGWARARRGHVEEGIERIRRFLDESRTADSQLFEPYARALLADAYAEASRPAEGVEALGEALRCADRIGSGWWKPELYRLAGELHRRLPRPSPDRVGELLTKARDLAREQRQKILELRALLSLARFSSGDDKRSQPILAELAELYRSFSEGFDSADLVEARRLLGLA